jgi:acyl-CoA reductase-like NAD-dependent aldehyde dehydrogenase
MKDFKLFINNKWMDAENGDTFFAIDPARNEKIARLAKATKSDVDQAVQVAKQVFSSGIWSDLDGDLRASYMLKAAEIMRRREKELAKWEAMDTGKPINETELVDIPYSIRAMEYFANQAREISGMVIPIPGEQAFDWVSYEPFGVVAAITPWNFPLHLATRAICPALATGNTVVAKASSLAPVTPIILGEIFEEAGLPAGTVNILSGPGTITGEALITHPDVSMITFTGSLEIGRKILEASAKSPLIKNTILELGGKGPFIAEPDCNIDDAVNQLIKGFCLMQGEVCCASTRLFLHEDIYTTFMDRLVRRVQSLRLGDTLDPETQMGSLINKSQLETVEARVTRALAEGGTLVTGGETYSEPPCDKGYYYKPTIIEDVKNSMTCAREEIFGPVLVVIKYKHIDEAIAMANDNQYALGATVYSENIRTLFYASRKLDSGTVWLNTNVMSKIEAPYGGSKNSGLGREDGIIGLKEYLKVKNNVLNLSSSVDNFYHFER